MNCVLNFVSRSSRQIGLVSSSLPSRTNLARFLSTIDYSRSNKFDRDSIKGPHGSYSEEYNVSISEPERFWSRAADLLYWHKKPQTILDKSEENSHFHRWFPDGVINTCHNCLDVHVQDGRGDLDALIFDSPLTGVKEKYTYSDLLEQVSTFAGALLDLGVERGDRVVIYMPMIPEAVIAMLACARIGAVHSVVFGGFASPELAKRITDCQPKIVVSASAGIQPGGRIVPYKPLLDKALELADHSVTKCVIVQRPNLESCALGPDDVDYNDLMANSEPAATVPLLANHTHYVLYTSGTTGLPKGVVRDTGSWAVALKWSMGAFYNTNPGEVFFTASDIGWVVGHSYIVYAPLLNGCTTILYEGKPVGTPDAGAFWRVCSEYSVKTLFAAPTAFRAMKQADPDADLAKEYDLSSLGHLFLAGEHSDPDTLHWCEKALERHGITPIDHWWQTELGFPGVGNSVGLGHVPIRHGACAFPVPGFDIHIVDDEGNRLPPETLGDMVIKTPLPPGCFPTLYNDDERYVKDYMTKYPGYYDTGDAAYIDSDGYVHIMGRTDDIINTAGHRLSTGTMEEVLMDHPEVADCAVVRMNDDLKGEIPLGFVVTNAGSTVDHDVLRKQLISSVRDSLGPVASFKKVAVVKGLPKTRSGKILRGTMTKIANGELYRVTPTVEDASIFEYLKPEIEKLARSEVE